MAQIAQMAQIACSVDWLARQARRYSQMNQLKIYNSDPLEKQSRQERAPS